jgi:hypothetical protein
MPIRRKNRTGRANMPRNCNPEKTVARGSFSQMLEIKKVRPTKACTNRPTAPMKRSIFTIVKDGIWISIT